MAFTNIGSAELESSQSIGLDSPLTLSPTIPDLGDYGIGIVIVNAHLVSATRTITSVTWGGETLTKAVPTGSNVLSNYSNHIYFKVNPLDADTRAIVVNFQEGGAPVAASVHVVAIWASAGNTVSLDDTSTTSGTTQNPSITSTQSEANELVISGSGSSANAIGSPSTTNCTELQSWDSGGNCSIGAYSIPSSSGDTTHTHNYSQNGTYGITSASFKEASSGTNIDITLTPATSSNAGSQSVVPTTEVTVTLQAGTTPISLGPNLVVSASSGSVDADLLLTAATTSPALGADLISQGDVTLAITPSSASVIALSITPSLSLSVSLTSAGTPSGFGLEILISNGASIPLSPGYGFGALGTDIEVRTGLDLGITPGVSPLSYGNDIRVTTEVQIGIQPAVGISQTVNLVVSLSGDVLIGLNTAISSAVEGSLTPLAVGNYGLELNTALLGPGNGLAPQVSTSAVINVTSGTTISGVSFILSTTETQLALTPALGSSAGAQNVEVSLLTEASIPVYSASLLPAGGGNVLLGLESFISISNPGVGPAYASSLSIQVQIEPYQETLTTDPVTLFLILSLGFVTIETLRIQNATLDQIINNEVTL